MRAVASVQTFTFDTSAKDAGAQTGTDNSAETGATTKKTKRHKYTETLLTEARPETGYLPPMHTNARHQIEC